MDKSTVNGVLYGSVNSYFKLPERKCRFGVICSLFWSCRITWAEGDPKKGVFYQYIMRRVAYKDPQCG